jgi:hypothetical protein
VGGRHAHRPGIDIDIIQRGMGSKNDPMFVAYPYDAPYTSKAIIDACRPYDHLHEFPDVAEASRALQEHSSHPGSTKCDKEE